MNRFAQVFTNSVGKQISVIGMVHIRSLPTSPLSKGLSVQQLIDISCNETEIYLKHKLNAILLENMFDIPYVRRQDSGPEVTAILTRVCSEVKKLAHNIPVGVQVLAGLNHEALAIALASGLQFIRCESFVFSHIADEGFMDGCSGSLLRYRQQLNAKDILILTDIKKKHSSHAITSDVDVIQTAKAAQFFLSDGIIITGLTTGHSPDLKVIEDLNKSGLEIPVLIGSGVNDSNVKSYTDLDVNAVIVGSHFKEFGVWSNELSVDRIKRFMDRVNEN